MNDGFVPTTFKFASLYAITNIALTFTFGLVSLIFDLDILVLSSVGYPLFFVLPFGLGAVGSLRGYHPIPVVVGTVLGALLFWGGTLFVLHPSREPDLGPGLRFLIVVGVATVLSGTVGAMVGGLVGRRRRSASGFSDADRTEGDPPSGPTGGGAC